MAVRGRESAEADLFRTSAFLMREHIAQSSGRSPGMATIVYVYDSDIIKTRCAPWITGPAVQPDQAGNGYGQIFAPARSGVQDGGESEAKSRTRSAEKVAYILARHALAQGAEPGLPILQLPPHFSETNNVYRAVRRNVEAIEKIDERRSRLRRDFELTRLLAMLRHRFVAEDDEVSLRDVIGKVADLLAYRSEGSTRRSQVLREWDTYFDLEAEHGGIYSASAAASFFPDEPAIRDAVAVFDERNRSADEQYLYDRLKRHWVKILRKSEAALDTDVEGLAQLFLVNLRLLDHNIRFIFISGDRNLVESTYEDLPVDVMLRGCGDLKLRLKAELLSKCFSFHHVRHLWAFVSDALIEQKQQDEFVGLFEKVLSRDIFSGLLAKWSDTLDVSTKTLERLALDSRNNGGRQTAGPAIGQIKEVLSEWDNLTHKAIQQSALGLQDQEVRAAILTRVQSKSIGSTWTDLIGILEEDVARVRDRTVLAMAALGVRQVIQASLIGTRNPPEIVFDSLKRTNALIQKFARAGSPISIDEFVRDFGLIKDDCHNSSLDGDDRQESYLKFVVLGAAFASAERWLIASSYAHKAIAIIERSRRIGSLLQTRPRVSPEDPETNMSGREAFFLAAVSQRMMARDDSDILRAETFLIRAEKALVIDHQKRTAWNINSARFTNERAALRLSQYYLARSRDERDYRNELALYLYIAIEEVLDEFRPRFGLESCSPLERVTLILAATNVIQCYVISEFRRLEAIPFTELSPVRLRDLAACLTVLETHTTYEANSNADDGRITATPLIRSYACVAELLLGRSPHSDDSVDRLAGMQNLENLYVTHYDRWRYAALLTFARKYRDRQRAEIDLDRMGNAGINGETERDRTG